MNKSYASNKEWIKCSTCNKISTFENWKSTINNNKYHQCPICGTNKLATQLIYLGESPFINIEYISFLGGFDYKIALEYYDSNTPGCFLRDYVRDAVTIDSDFGKPTYKSSDELIKEINKNTILSIFKNQYPELMNDVKNKGIWFNKIFYLYEELKTYSVE